MSVKAGWYDTKSNVKLLGFRSQLEAYAESSHTENLRYNETVYHWMTIYIYIYIYIQMNFERSVYISYWEQMMLNRSRWKKVIY